MPGTSVCPSHASAGGSWGSKTNQGVSRPEITRVAREVGTESGLGRQAVVPTAAATASPRRP
jgi:hypothetical protein